MDSFFARLFLDLQARIKDQIPAINWIEQDFGQDTFDKWRPNVDFPAVLIDFPDASYSQMAGNDQFGEVTIMVRLLVAPFTQSYEGAPIEVKQDALQFFELENAVVNALNGWTPRDGYCQSLVRTRAQSHNRNDIGLRIRELQFTTAYEDYQ
ncbi:MAG: hypothetical protein F8N15_03595 [Methanobacterium sp.]|nr:hypothetical protein [Methanobacterium sp.]